MINHLDWFVASVYQVVNGLDINPEGKTDINNFLSSACIAVNHFAHLQAHNLASNATIRREAFLEASVLSREEAHYLRSRGIGCVDLLGGEGNEAMKRASQEKRTSLLFQSTVGAPHRPVHCTASHAPLKRLASPGDNGLVQGEGNLFPRIPHPLAIARNRPRPLQLHIGM